MESRYVNNSFKDQYYGTYQVPTKFLSVPLFAAILYMDESQRTGIMGRFVEDTDGVPGSWLGPGCLLGEWTSGMKIALFLCLVLFLSLCFQIRNPIHNYKTKTICLTYCTIFIAILLFFILVPSFMLLCSSTEFHQVILWKGYLGYMYPIYVYFLCFTVTFIDHSILHAVKCLFIYEHIL